jgi:isopentenyldiphosphate isomerase
MHRKQEIIIVDEHDSIIGYKPRDQIQREDIYRVSAVWITDTHGKILLARRSFTKKTDPGKWGPAAAGTLEKGETYETNIKKETQEELGITGIIFTPSLKKRRQGERNFFVQYYTAIVDRDRITLSIQHDEVAEIHWFTREELAREVSLHPGEFLPVVHEFLSQKT